RLYLQAKVDQSMEPDEDSSTRRDAGNCRILPSPNGSLKAYPNGDDHAGDEHRSKHETEALQDFKVAVVGFVPNADNAHRPIPIHREDIGKGPVSESKERRVANARQCEPVNRHPALIIDAARFDPPKKCIAECDQDAAKEQCAEKDRFELSTGTATAAG